MDACQSNNTILILIILIVMAAIVLIALPPTAEPTTHVERRHPDAILGGLFNSDFKCRWQNGEKVLYLTDDPAGCDPKDTIGGVITTSDGRTITGFWARAKYWARVLGRDNYRPIPEW